MLSRLLYADVLPGSRWPLKSIWLRKPAPGHARRRLVLLLAWLALLCAPAALAQGTDNAAFVSQTAPPTTIRAGQTYAVAVTMQNTGTSTWATDGSFALNSQNPGNNNWWNVQLVSPTSPVAPGQSFTFSFPVTAPSIPSTYNFQWRMVHQGVALFGDYSANVVCSNPVDDAAFVSQTAPPTTIRAGQAYSVAVTMQNTGTSTWSAGSTYQLVSQNPGNNNWWGVQTINVPTAVAPGAQVTFSFTATAPSLPGTYNFQWQMVHQGVALFGDFTQNVVCSNPADDAAFVSQSGPPSPVTMGQTYPVSVTMKNVGTSTWATDGSFALNSQNPNGNNWWGVQLVNPPASVAPGSQATFSFTASAPTTTGTHFFQWRMLHQGTALFGDYSTNLTIQVNAPTLTSIVVSPASASLHLNAMQAFTAVAKDQNGNALSPQPSLAWSLDSGGVGSINAGSGLYASSGTPGTATVRATSGSISGTAAVTVTNAAPTVATPAAASPSPVTGTTTSLSVLGADDGGESNLTYTWATTGTPPAPVTFSANGTNAAKTVTATFTKSGAYSFQVTLTDVQGATKTSTVSVTVNQTATTLSLSPSSATVTAGGTQQFTGTVKDQFGTALATQPTLTWSAVSGSVSASGLYTAPASGSSDTVQAVSGSLTGTASVNLVGAVPAAPTNLTATAVSTAQINLSWTAPAGSGLTYNVYRGTAPGGEGSTPLATGLTTIVYSDTPVVAGTTYYYKVAAVNANGTGPLSAEAQATSLPVAPTSVAATGGSAQVSISWAASAGATSYNLYRSLTSGGEGSTAYKSGVTSPYVDTNSGSGLTNGQPYFYQVTALDAGGESARSSEVSATPLAAPTGLTAVAATGQVTLSWTGSMGATGYNVKRSTVSGGPYTTFASPSGTSATDTGLTNGTTYYYVVSAINAGGASGNSSQVSATPLAAPTNLAAAPGNAQVSLTWTAPTGLGLTYNVYRGTAAGAEGTTAIASGLTTPGYTDSSVTNGTAYFYTVKALNSSGSSGPSGEASATPQVPVPAAPANPVASPGNGRITVSWSASAGATSYNLYRSTTANGEGATPYRSGVTSPLVDTGLTNGQPYFYQVTAVNAGGESAKSVEASATPVASPSAPTNLSAVAGNNSVSLTWTAPAGSGLTYNVYRGTSAGGELPTALATGLNSASYNDPNAANGTTYYYKVTAVNAGGESGPSNEASAMPVAPPAAPTNLVATGGNNLVSLTWTAPSGPVASYNVKRSTVSGGPYATISTAGQVTTTAYPDNSAANGTTYYYVVSAINAGGEGANSAPASATPQAPLPTVSSVSVNPTTVTGGTSSTGTVTLTSAAPTGGAVVTLSSSSSAAAPPATVTVPAGAVSATFTITTTGVTTSTTATVSATYNSTAQTAPLTINPPVLASLTLSPPSITGGGSSTGTVMLNGPAPAGGVTVNLASDNAAATVPGSVLIAAGAQSAMFTASTTMVTTSTTANVSATYAGVTQTAGLTITPVSTSSGLRIDAGAATPYTDSQSNVWAADEYSSGGFSDAPMPAPAIANTSDPKLFQTQREETTAGSSFSYTLPVANGTYSLNLLFAEIDGKAAGQRVFNVTANGTALLTGFDIYTAAGNANKPITRSFLVTVTNGQLNVVFTGTTGQAAVSAISLTAPGGGTPAADSPAPGWASQTIPSDSADAGGAGPSSSEGVSLPSGVKENTPGPDLMAYNPVGPSAFYQRSYRSLMPGSHSFSGGLSPGWVDNYDLTVTSTGVGSYRINYPNGAAERWATAGGMISPPSGAPYLISSVSGAPVMTFKDHSTFAFTADPNVAGQFLLTRIGNVAGQGININRDAAPGNNNRISTITNDAGLQLLAFVYQGANLQTVTDTSDPNNPRQITYAFTGGNLTGVSLVNSPTAMRWQYGYQTINGFPNLNAVQAADPTANSGLSSPAGTQYDANGRVLILADANGNRRVYTYTGTSTQVSVYGSDGTLAQQWTQKFDPANHNVDTGIVDALGHFTTLVYGDSANPYKVTAASNKNLDASGTQHQTASATYDRYGNATRITDLRSVDTTTTYDPTFPLGQPIDIKTGSAANGYKTSTQFSYYANNTVVNTVLQPNGLIQTMAVPTPGTTGSGARVTTTYVYTALGNIASITSPAPSTSGSTVTTQFSYAYDSSYGPNGEAGSSYTTTEARQQPLTITDPLGLVTHFRYDAHGNLTLVISPLGFKTAYAYNSRDQLIRITYPFTGTGQGNLSAQTEYTYYSLGGPLQFVTVFDENGYKVRQSTLVNGKEGEAKQQTGSVQEATFGFDPRYRLTQQIDGNTHPAKTYQYDKVGNVSAMTYAMGDGSQYPQFDADNNLLKRVDGRGVITNYTRAPDDSRVIGAAYSDGTPSVQFGANGNGFDQFDRVTQMTDGTGTTASSYDDDDNLLSVTRTYNGPTAGSYLPAKTISYTYNYDGSRATMTVPNGTSAWTFNYQYDNDGRPTKVIAPWTGGSYKYDYDSDSRLIHQGMAKANTYYTFNARDFLTNEQIVSIFLSSNYNEPPIQNENGNTGHPLVADNSQGAMNTPAPFSKVLLGEFSAMQYDALGNRTQMKVFTPNIWFYDPNNSYNTSETAPRAGDTDGIYSYTYDSKDRLTLETSNNLQGNPTFEDYPSNNGTYIYNDNYNYIHGADPADNLTTLRNNTLAYNADDQLMAASYDGEGNRTSYNGSTVSYDAESRPKGVSSMLTAAFTGDGLRAWKGDTNGNNRNYFLYDGDHVVCQMDASGNPINTFGYGANGLVQRYLNASNFAYSYVFDPNGNVFHRIRDANPITSGVFVDDTALYDGFGQLRCDADSFGVGFHKPDMVGYHGQWGDYTDTETLKPAAGTYLSLMGGSLYYDPDSAVGMARGGGLNDYKINLNPFADYDPKLAARFGLGEVTALGNFTAAMTFDSVFGDAVNGLAGGKLQHPFSAGSSEAAQDGDTFGTGLYTVGSLAAGFAGGGAVAVEGEAGAFSKAATKGDVIPELERYGFADNRRGGFVHAFSNDRLSGPGGSPALKGDPYSPEAVEARIKPPYEINYKHVPGHPDYRRKADVLPSDAEEAYERAEQSRVGTWWAKGKEGWYRFFSNNVGTAHYTGTFPQNKAPVWLVRGQ